MSSLPSIEKVIKFFLYGGDQKPSDVDLLSDAIIRGPELPRKRGRGRATGGDVRI